MKKLIFLHLAVLLLFASCANEENIILNSSSIDTQSKISNYIDENYPDAQILTINTLQGITVAALNTGETIYFDASGVQILPTDLVSKVAADSIVKDTTTQTNDTTKRWRPDLKSYRDSLMHNFKNDLKLQLKNDTTLRSKKDSLVKSIRDSVNKLVKDSLRTLLLNKKQQRDSVISTIKAKKDSLKHIQDSIKAVKDSIRNDKMVLQNKIKDYITANYAAYTTLGVNKFTDCSGSFIVATVSPVVTDKTTKAVTDLTLKLHFDLSGNYVKKSSRMLSSELPAAVSNISSSYANYKLAKKAEIFTLLDGTVQYRIYFLPNDLSATAIKLNVLAAADGTIVCN